MNISTTMHVSKEEKMLAEGNIQQLFLKFGILLYLGVQLYVGLSDGIIRILSYSFGADQRQRMKATLRLASRTDFVIGLLFFTTLPFGSEFLVVRCFKTDVAGDVATIQSIAVTGATWVAFAFLFNGQNILSSSFFTSMGNAKLSVVISLLRGLLLVVSGLYLLPLVFGKTGFWMVIPLAECITLLNCWWITRKKVSWLYL